MRAHLQGRAQGSAAVSCAVVTSRQGADSFGLDQGCWEAIAYPFLRTFAAARLTELAEARVSFNFWEIEKAHQSFITQGRKRLPEDQPPFSERQGSRWQREQGAGGPLAVPFKKLNSMSPARGSHCCFSFSCMQEAQGSGQMAGGSHFHFIKKNCVRTRCKGQCRWTVVRNTPKGAHTGTQRN